MNKKQFSEHIGNIDDRLVQQAEIIPNYVAQHRQKRIRQLLATAAALVLMFSSFSVGAIAFAREVPVEQENVVLEEIGLTLILPDSWKGKYEVIEDVFVPNNSTMWEFCVKSVYDAQTPTGESGQVLYRGTLFYIFQYTNYSMSAEEFEQSGIAGIGRYLFATENATYVILYTTDLQFDPENSVQLDEWNAMEQTEKEIRFVVDNILKD